LEKGKRSEGCGTECRSETTEEVCTEDFSEEEAGRKKKECQGEPSGNAICEGLLHREPLQKYLLREKGSGDPKAARPP